MANTKATSNEQIIAALLQHGTVKEAAAAGVNICGFRPIEKS
jgi:hypothetical protein